MEIDHCEDGFECERFGQQVFVQAREQCVDLKWATFRQIISKMCPQSAAGLFARRPCQRKLKYIGDRDFEEPVSQEHGFFKVGQIYQSLTFNGSTYTIEGYQGGEKPIGCAYFDRIT
jgi:hypothetical protein